jgi:hypothetical protein
MTTATAECAPAQRLAEVRKQFKLAHQPEDLTDPELLAIREAIQAWRSLEARVFAAEQSRGPYPSNRPVCGWGPFACEPREHPDGPASPLWAVIEDMLAETPPETLCGQSEAMAAERRAWDALFINVMTVRASRHPNNPDVKAGRTPLSGWGPYGERQTWPGMQ